MSVIPLCAQSAYCFATSPEANKPLASQPAGICRPTVSRDLVRCCPRPASPPGSDRFNG
jgi:hypothetical protein